MSNQNESLSVNAKTIDEAIELGLNQLGLTRDQVDIEIVNEGKRGLFGLGVEEALVRLTPKSRGDEEQQVSNASTLEESDSPESDEPVEEDVPPNGDQDQTNESGDQAKTVEEIGRYYLDGLLKRMGIQAEITTRIATDLVEPGEEAPLVFDIQGKDLGILIGRRNETLQALQYMLRLMVSKEMESWQRIVVDVESYRSRRRQTLHKIAQRMAEQAVANNERVVLEAMPAYERRIIHIALRDHPTVITKSIGRDNNRKVTIIPK